VNTHILFSYLNSNKKLSYKTIHSSACLFCNRLLCLTDNTTSTALCIRRNRHTNICKSFSFSTNSFFSLFFISIFYRNCCMILKQQHIGLFNRCILLFKRCLLTTKTNIFTTKSCLSTTKRYIIWYKRCFFLFKRCLPTTKPNIFTTKTCLSTTKRYIIWYKRCFLLFKRCLPTTKPNIFTTKSCLSTTKRYIIWYKRCFFSFKRCLSTTDSYLTNKQPYSFSTPLQRRLSNRLTIPRYNKTNEQPIIFHITNSLQFSLFSF